MRASTARPYTCLTENGTYYLFPLTYYLKKATRSGGFFYYFFSSSSHCFHTSGQ